MIKKIVILILAGALLFLSGCGGEMVTPTENGLSLTVEPNPVAYDAERDGWYVNITIKNLGAEKVYLVQANITAIAKVLFYSFDLPEQVYYPDDLVDLFGTSVIEPYGSVSWEKGISYQEIEDMIAGYEGYPGVSVNALISGLKLRIFVYGVTASGTHVDASSSVVTFSPKP